MTISEYLDKVAEVTGGKAWGLAHGKPRVYLKSRKDIKIFISFEDAAYSSPDDQCDFAVTGLFGEKLNCFINDCGQSPKWYASQKEIALKGARPAFDAACWFALTRNEDEAAKFIDGEIEISDEAAHHMLNGREDEARAALGF